MKKFIIAGIGELLWDVLQGTEVIGGAPVNFAYHVQALGAKGIPISTVGRDPRGEKGIDELEKRGLDTMAISVSEYFATGYVTATVDEEGKATYSFPDDVAWDHLHLNDYVEKVRNDLDAVCFGSLAQRSEHSRREIYSFLDNLNEKTVKIFDVNLRQNFYSLEILEASLKRADILKLNDEELPVLAKLFGVTGKNENWLSVLIKRYQLEMAILSRGSKGSLLLTPENSSEHPGFSTNIVDTIGAGDAFTAAAIIGYLLGYPLGEINEKANKLAAYVCSQQGGMAPVPDFLKMIPAAG